MTTSDVEEQLESSRKNDRPERVVGIGASAGGLESLERFFDNMPADTGLAFVIIQHLSPDYRSMMDELLARHTSMPIEVVRDNTKVKSNHIYLLPPAKEMTIVDDHLLLTDKSPIQSFTLPIDKFLRSLASDRAQQAVAIILSGTGSDGSRGLRDVKRAGGTVIVEDPDSAKFDGMPLSALATNMVDHVATPQKMPYWLTQGSASPPSIEETPEESPMESILRMLRAHSSVDFSHYKKGTVTRRIERRVSMMKDAADLADYAQRLATEPREVNALYHDLLIGVTRFFRDPECFDVLSERIAPELLKRINQNEELRVWVAGCATGEEAYSIAMILYEAHVKHSRPLNVKILATDVHRASLEAASRGIYGEDQLVHVSKERRARFFSKRGENYQVSPELRKLIVFAPHNVIKDAPFTKMHLISCRNMLIYLEPAAQNTVLSLFHFSLALNGVLFLGSSESTGSVANEFNTLDEHCKFFQKRRDVRLLEPRRLAVSPHHLATANSYPNRVNPAADSRLLWLYDRLLDRHMPPSFLVDEDRNLLDSFAGAERWLRVNRRRPSTSLLDMLGGELRAVIAGTLQQALKRSGSVQYNALELPDEEGKPSRYRLSAHPIVNNRTGTRFVVLTFDPLSTPTPVEEIEYTPPSNDTERVQTLEGELSYARETLQATVEELQTSNEQLQATNEELVASNEELQSTNEELQSVNEELYTVNAEHQKKIAELGELNADMQHLLEGTDIGTLFLDGQLRIRKYTPRIAGLFHIQPQDVGRNIQDFAHSLRRPSLLSEIEQVRERGVVIEDEVKDAEGASFFLRILAYRPNEGRPDTEADIVPAFGVVLTLTDISALDRARARLAELSAIVESSDDAIIGTTTEGTITTWNRGAERLYGYHASDTIGRHIDVLVGPEGQLELSELVEAATGGRSVEQVATVHLHAAGHPLDVSIAISPIRDQTGEVVGASAISRNIGPLKRAERQLQERSDRIRLLLNSTAEAIFGLGMDGRCTFGNPACARLLGYDSSDDLIGVPMREVLAPHTQVGRERVPRDAIFAVLESGTGTHSDAELFTRRDGSSFHAEYWSHPIREAGSMVGAVVTFLDISDRKRAESEIRLASERREQFLAMLSHELRNPLSAVLTATKLMDERRENAQAIQRARGVIDRQAKHMACLLEDLLDVSRINRGTIRLKQETVDLRATIEMAIEALGPFLKQTDTDLKLQLSDESLLVDGDAARLQQVVANLLSNAARHSPHGTRVTISTSANQEEIVLEVTDSGSGISPSMLPQIFDLFVQSEQPLDRAKGGLGIGLTLVRKIVELHGGNVHAASEGEGHGSCFTVVLPRSKRTHTTPKSGHSNGCTPRRIVIVEDQDDSRDMLRMLLEARGNSVSDAADGADAIDLIKREKPDAALIDVGLPTMSGYEIARVLRQDPAMAKVKLIALTGYGTSQDIAAARDAGFNAHLTKPVDADTIENALQSE